MFSVYTKKPSWRFTKSGHLQARAQKQERIFKEFTDPFEFKNIWKNLQLLGEIQKKVKPFWVGIKYLAGKGVELQVSTFIPYLN